MNPMPSSIIQCHDAICIVGAGPGGLSIARALKAHGLAYEQFERHSGVGGIWDIGQANTPIYESAHFISSRDLSGFIGFPMPSSFPDYPSHRQIFSYVQAFAQAFDLLPAIRFYTTVTDVCKTPEGRWRVSVQTDTDGQKQFETREYRAIICATGCNWDPHLPPIKGQFSGELQHSVRYKSAREFAQKRVLIVGAGNSGVDIACDAASWADEAFISMRRGYYFIPKHIFGIPADEFSEKGPHLPLWLARPIFSWLLKLITGDLRRFGLPLPTHRLFEAHPLMNSQLLHHLQHGNIKVKPDVDFYEGNQAVFTDGSRVTLDKVIYATGYQWSCPYAQQYFSWRGGRPSLYLSMFSREHHNLYGIGYLETNSSAYKLFDTQAYTIASYLNDQLKNPLRAKKFAQLIANDQPDLSGGIRFIASQRHEVYVDAHRIKSYLQKIHRQMGWSKMHEKMYPSRDFLTIQK